MSPILAAYRADVLQKAASQDLIGDMLRSMLKRVLANNDPTRSLYLLLQDRLLFLQELDKVVPNSPNLRRGVLGALSTMEFSELVDVFVRHTITAPAPSDACGENEACRWFILNLTNKLQLALCTFILRCALFSQADADTKLFPEMAILLMGKLGNLSAAQPQCPFESTLKSTTSCDTLSLIEESASPEVRFSSRNWRQSLMNGLSRDSDRQHAFIVATVGEICRDLEHRCDNVEKPLRVEEENSQRLQEELDRLKAKFIEVEEQLVRCLHSLDHSAGEKEQLENKLDGALERSKETFGRIKELEQVIETESEGSRQAANLAAMEHMAALNTRQEMIDELQEHKRELEQETDDLQDAALHLKENKSRLEESVKTLQVLVAEAQTELRESKEEVEKLGVEKTKLQESLEAAEQDLTQVRVEKIKLEESLESVGQDLKEARIEKTKLQESLESADKGLTEVSAALEEHKLVVKEKLLDIDRQQKIIDEMVNENGRQKEEIGLLEGTRENMQEKILALEKTVEKAMQDGEQKCKTLSAKLISNHNQQVCWTTSLSIAVLTPNSCPS